MRALLDPVLPRSGMFRFGLDAARFGRPLVRWMPSRPRDRKVANIERTRPEMIAAGDDGCMAQIASGTGAPVVHTVELLDWATGGPRPPGVPT